MRFYHRTTRTAAAAIVAGGFVDTEGYYGLFDEVTGEPIRLCGVWVSDMPLDENEGAVGEALLRVTLALPSEDLAAYELIEEPQEVNGRLFAKGYREWCIPAALLNVTMTVEILDDEAEERAIAEHRR